jgi:hypothetical protein
MARGHADRVSSAEVVRFTEVAGDAHPTDVPAPWTEPSDMGGARRYLVLEVKMSQGRREGQSGGVTIAGTIGSVGGDIVGRDKIVGIPTREALDQVFKPLLEMLA